MVQGLDLSTEIGCLSEQLGEKALRYSRGQDG